MNFYSELENLLNISDPRDKCAQAQMIIPQLLDILNNSPENAETELNFSAENIYSPGKPSYYSFCTLVHGSQVKRRKNLDTPEGKAVFIHAITHIEYSAIDLSLDAAYRFRGLPRQYYLDWLSVADDEIRHFLMLSQILGELGHNYGDFPVHDGLFMAGKRSRHSLSVRMAAVHRHLEGNGLDAFPEFERKFSTTPDILSQKIYAALKLIAFEEIRHVSLGTKWFLYACEMEKIPSDHFHQMVENAIPNVKFSRAKLNKPARLAAGFTEIELENWPENTGKK